MNDIINIYKLNNRVVALRDQLLSSVDEDGEVNEQLLAYFEESKADLQEGCLQFGQMVKSIEAYISAIASEQDRLKELSDRLKNKAEKAKETLTRYMEENGLKKLENPNVSIKISPSVKTIIDNPSEVPQDFKRLETKVEEKIDKTAIKKAIQEGHEVTGAHLEECRNINIK